MGFPVVNWDFLCFSAFYSRFTVVYSVPLRFFNVFQLFVKRMALNARGRGEKGETRASRSC